MRTALAFAPTFTGDVAVDFPIGNPGVFTALDPPNDVAVTGFSTGWDISDIRFAYDAATDTGFFGEDTQRESTVAFPIPILRA